MKAFKEVVHPKMNSHELIKMKVYSDHRKHCTQSIVDVVHMTRVLF